MNDKQAIIDKIIGDATAKAAEIKAAATAKAEGIREITEVKVSAILLTANVKAAKDAAFIVEAGERAAILDASLITLAKKNELIDKAFAAAGTELIKSEEYSLIIKKLVEKHADKNDKVVVDGGGGIIIEGEAIDKNFTVKALLTQIRAESIVEIAKLLFG